MSRTRPLLTVRLRLRDKHCRSLNAQARSVNFVWNYVNEVQKKAVQSLRPWMSKYDLMQLTAGAAKDLGLHAHTIQRVCRLYDESRRSKGRAWLRWRGRKSLGWVPFNTGHVRFDGERFIFNGVAYEAMHLRDALASGMRFGAGSFSADAKGHWYINLPCEMPCSGVRNSGAVGIDLGLKTLAALSDGEAIAMPSFYRKSEAALAQAQRARKSKRAKAIHGKIVNRRKDFLHKASRALCEKYGLIIVGDVSPSKLAKTRMAKSILDASWSGFRHMLSYKAIRHGGRMVEVPEAYTTQTCSTCGALPPSRPRGIAGLPIREWTCSDCETVHDRDTNAARNILRFGLEALVEGALQ
jgi:IS605 OrfB family transposase